MIPFNEAIERLDLIIGKTKELIIPTLGQQSLIRVYIEAGQIVIKNSRENIWYVNETKWNAVYQRRNSLPGNRRNNTGQYGNPTWNTMPDYLNFYLAPYIPAIMRFLEDPSLFKNFEGPINTFKEKFPDKISKIDNLYGNDVENDIGNNIHQNAIYKFMFT
jgi:hypothetical protein